MFAILRQLLVTGALVMLFWLAMQVILKPFPVMRDHVDTGEGRGRRSLLFESEIAQTVAEFHLLAGEDKPNVILLGGSSIQYAILPDQLAPLLDGYRVHSLALNGSYGGGSIGETFEKVKDAVELMPAAMRERSVFVLGMVPQMFEMYVGNRPFDATRLLLYPRLFQKKGDRVAMRFGSGATVLAMRFTRPFLVLRRFAEVSLEAGGVGAGWNWLTEGNHLPTVPPSGMEGEAVDLNSINDGYLDVMFTLFDDIESNPNYRELAPMFDYFAERRLQLIVVDLPFLDQVKKKYPAYRRYREIVHSLATHPRYQGSVFLVDLSDLLADSGFRDSSHVRESATPHCAYALWRNWPLAADVAKQ